MDISLYPIAEVGLGFALLTLGLLVRRVPGRREVMLQHAVLRRRSTAGEDAR